MMSYGSFLTNMEASSPMRKLPLRPAGGPPYNFPPCRRFLEASRGEGGGGPYPPPSISKFKNFFFFFFLEYGNIRKMGPNGAFKYIWYLDLFGVVYFLEVLAPPCIISNSKKVDSTLNTLTLLDI